MLDKRSVNKIRKLNSDGDHTTVLVFKALSDVNRYRIFHILAEHPKISVSNIAQILNISTSLASIHLKVLFQAKLLSKEKVGKNVYSKLNTKNPVVRMIVQVIVLY